MSLDDQLEALTDKVFDGTAATVQSGPFAGMKLVKEASWGAGDLLQKLLGIYESELHETIVDVIASGPDLVVNVGCAEGYYAVGLASRLPTTPIYAFDIDPQALNVCKSAAVANGAESHLRLQSDANAKSVSLALMPARNPFLLVDCEGCEIHLLAEIDPDVLAKTTVLVECHDFIDPACTEKVIKTLAGTHVLKKIEQGSRNPNEIAFLRNVNEDLRWLAMSEGRPNVMGWIFAKPVKNIWGARLLGHLHRAMTSRR